MNNIQLQSPGNRANHNFAQVPQATIPRSSFNRSSTIKTTFDAGYLVPLYVEEVLPGDTHNVNVAMFGRLATPIFPFMDNLYLDMHFFFVPTRLLWTNWQKFMGERINPDDSTDYLVPTLTSPVGGYSNSTIFDYIGLPTQVAGIAHSVLPLRAYNLIYNEWYRDQNLIDSVTVNTGDSGDTVANYTLLKRGKRHDYFTSALPWPQKGPSVPLPLTGNAPVSGTATVASDGTFALSPTVGGTAYHLQRSGTATGANWITPDGGVTHNTNHYYKSGLKVDASTMYADLSAVTAATINELRQAFQVQRIYERDARGGTRYIEILKSHFGVTSPDARLQRPEYLGGSTSRINVNPIAQTSATTSGETPLATLAAMGTVFDNNAGFVKSFVEHGYILGIASVRADLTYQQGLHRMWSRSTRFDFFWPSLANIGEQAILNKEIYAQGTTADDDVFGYQERYAEYRYRQSMITGQFRSNFAQSLDGWHLAQDFSTLPVLDQTFIEETPPIDRVVAVPTYPDMILDMAVSQTSARPMPVYSVPGLIDHF